MLYKRYVRRLDREAREKARDEVLALLDEDTRKDVERKLEPNGDSDTRD